MPRRSPSSMPGPATESDTPSLCAPPLRRVRPPPSRTMRTAMSVTDSLSIQLYTLRSLDDLDRILDTVAEAGYRHVETVGSHLDDAANVRAKLDARGLKASSSHVSLGALREKPEA